MRSKFSWSSLSRRQRTTLLIIALFNFSVLGTLGVVLLSDFPPTRDQAAGPDNTVECEQDAALTLRQAGVGGSVTIVSNQSIQVDVSGPDAEAAWQVFSMTVRLISAGCGPYNVIRVDVPDPEKRPNTRLVVELSWPEVQAWANGKFDDGQLSERMRRRLYQTAPMPTPAP